MQSLLISLPAPPSLPLPSVLTVHAHSRDSTAAFESAPRECEGGGAGTQTHHPPSLPPSLPHPLLTVHACSRDSTAAFGSALPECEGGGGDTHPIPPSLLPYKHTHTLPPSLPPSLLYVLCMLAAVTALLLLNQASRGVREEVEADTLSFAGEGLKEEMHLEGDQRKYGIYHRIGVILQ